MVILCIALLAACAPQGAAPDAAAASNPFIGRWCTDPPSSLLYEYLEDGSVHLFIESGEYAMFRYQLHPNQTLRLFDGMGRMLEYRYVVEGQGISLFSPADPARAVDHLTPPGGETCQ